MSREQKNKELEKLKQKLEELERERDSFKEGWQRERAEFLNFKKEVERRWQEKEKELCKKTVQRFLPILDNFQLALKTIPEEEQKQGSVKGLIMILWQLKDLLNSLGLEEIKSEGERFDPALHEAVEEVETDKVEPGVIIEELQKGYKFEGQVLRPARVRVAKSKVD